MSINITVNPQTTQMLINGNYVPVSCITLDEGSIVRRSMSQFLGVYANPSRPYNGVLKSYEELLNDYNNRIWHQVQVISVLGVVQVETLVFFNNEDDANSFMMAIDNAKE